MTERQFLMRKLMAERFAAIEVNLFLDTHPDNRQALSDLKKYVKNYNELKKEYECKFGPLTAFSVTENQDRWTWVNDPWPWD